MGLRPPLVVVEEEQQVTAVQEAGQRRDARIPGVFAVTDELGGVIRRIAVVTRVIDTARSRGRGLELVNAGVVRRLVGIVDAAVIRIDRLAVRAGADDGQIGNLSGAGGDVERIAGADATSEFARITICEDRQRVRIEVAVLEGVELRGRQEEGGLGRRNAADQTGRSD